LLPPHPLPLPRWGEEPLPRWGEEKGMPPKASLAKGGVKFQIFWAGSITI